MYKKGIYTVTANEPLTPSVWRMTLEGDTQYLTLSLIHISEPTRPY